MSRLVQLIDELADRLTVEMAFHCSYDQDPMQVHKEIYGSIIERLEEIRELANGPRLARLDCTEQPIFSAVADAIRKNSGSRGQTGGSGTEG